MQNSEIKIQAETWKSASQRRYRWSHRHSPASAASAPAAVAGAR
jgi:hypothetical protein